jgi:Mrp family chromosome partitioning ATPase
MEELLQSPTNVPPAPAPGAPSPAPPPEPQPGGVASPAAVGESAGAAQNEGLEGGGTRIERLDTNQAILAQTVNIRNMINSYGGNDEAASSRLTYDQFDPFNRDLLERAWKDLVFADSQIEPLAAQLEEGRLLVLSGPAGIGKSSTALLLAARMQQRHPVAGALLYRGVERSMRIDFPGITGGEGRFVRHVVVLESPSAITNPDLRRFLSQVTATRTSWTERLRQSGSFLLIVVADVQGIETCEIFRGLLPPPPDVLTEGLATLAQRLMEMDSLEGDGQLRKEVDDLIGRSGPLIAQHLGSLPRIARFVREYLHRVAEGRLTLEQALDRLDDLGHWLLVDLPEDFDLWCSVLALTLASAAPNRNAPWLQVELLRRALAKALGRELRRARTPGEARTLCRNDWTVERAGSEVLALPAPAADVLRFREPGAADRLWGALVREGRRLTASLVPVLCEQTQSSDYYLRQSAARALGRSGQMDPPYVAYRQIRRWSRSGEHDLLGWFLQGAFGSPDSEYQAFCLGILHDRLTLGEDKERSTAAASLRHIVDIRPEFVVCELRELTKAQLPIDWAKLRKAQDLLQWGEEELRTDARREGIAEQLKKLHELAEWLLAAEAFPQEKTDLLGACQFAFNGLFLADFDHAEALAPLADWMREEQGQGGPLVALFFLHPGGCAGHLAGAPLPSAARRQGFSRPISLLLLTVSEKPETAEGLRRFLEQVYIALNVFPGVFRRQLEASFLRLLASWARETYDAPLLKPALTNLLAALFSSVDERLSTLILQTAQESSPTEETMALRNLAIAAVTGGSPR